MVEGVLQWILKVRKPPAQNDNQGVPLGYQHENFTNQDPVEHP